VRPLIADLQQMLSSLPSSATAQSAAGGNGSGGNGGGAETQTETDEDVVDAEFTRE
jgi:hypothetical protein